MSLLAPRDHRRALLMITELSFCCEAKGWAEIPPEYKLEALNLCSDEQHWYNYLFTRFFYLSASNYMVIGAI